MTNALKKGREAGRRAGYEKGWQQGYHLGQCEAVLERQIPQSIPIADKTVIYVTAGIEVPYPAIDEAIIAALRSLVAHVVVASPADDVATLAQTIQPDLVLALNGVVFPEEQLQALRSAAIKTAVWFTDDPYYTDWTTHIALRYDFVFTLELSCVPFYESLGCTHVFYVPFAADTRVFRPKQVEHRYQSDICFIGTAFWNRVEMFDALASYLTRHKTVIIGWWWDRLRHYNQLAPHIQLGTWLSAEETASYYNGAKIVINLHRASDDQTINFNEAGLPAYSPNPRTFEIASCGAFQLTDERRELHHHFVPGEEIVTYSDYASLPELLDYYLKNEEERRRIAVNGLTRAHRDHAYEQRLTMILHTILQSVEVGER